MEEHDIFAEKTYSKVLNLFDKQMKKQGVSRYRLAKKTGITEAALSKYFSEKMKMSLLHHIKICGALDISLDWNIKK